jgi:hypothetical protein
MISTRYCPGVQPSGKPKTETIIKSIHDINAKHGSVKVVYPLSAVWSTPKGFWYFDEGQRSTGPCSGRLEGFADIGAKKTDELLEPSDDEAEEVEV